MFSKPPHIVFRQHSAMKPGLDRVKRTVCLTGDSHTLFLWGRGVTERKFTVNGGNFRGTGGDGMGNKIIVKIFAHRFLLL